MKEIVLISNKIFHYRVSVYNKFSEYFKSEGYDFSVFTNQIDSYASEAKFHHQLSEITFSKCISYLKSKNPAAVILFLHLKDFAIFPLTLYLKVKRIPFIYWNHGINLMDPNNTIKNSVFHYIHRLSDAIILYSGNEKKYIPTKHRKKVFIANNTLNFEDFSDIKSSKSQLKADKKIPFRKIVLYVGRILHYKRLDVLLNIFSRIENTAYGLIVIGDGLEARQKEMLDNISNATYLGPIYDAETINEYFYLADIFCIPGAIGLSVNQAMYWGAPVLTIDGLHGPEVSYIKNGENGYIAKNEAELHELIIKLLEDDCLRRKLSINAKNEMRHEGSLNKMFDGFRKAIHYVEEH